MSRGKNCLPTVSRQFLTRNYPRPNCLLKCLPNCLSPTREGFLSSFKINPAVRVIARQVRDKKLSRGNFCPATSICLFWPTGCPVYPVYGNARTGLLRTSGKQGAFDQGFMCSGCPFRVPKTVALQQELQKPWPSTE